MMYASLPVFLINCLLNSDLPNEGSHCFQGNTSTTVLSSFRMLLPLCGQAKILPLSSTQRSNIAHYLSHLLESKTSAKITHSSLFSLTGKQRSFPILRSFAKPQSFSLQNKAISQPICCFLFPGHHVWGFYTFLMLP